MQTKPLEDCLMAENFSTRVILADSEGGVA
jgi:hypothetical protein